ncbi:thioredoxin family protein [Sphingomonas sp. LY29]|uniref:protein-disulfide reductase DsbD family protein n=1 Tax=Sphingomonas sp. LY29 TaxID=3095341 RepID=UPI002D77378C|nr:thioredoxin family protein [Sphingomonas sp. LY29]WRP25453.1 thioredoxin family protein [Sphingomonas sp. LY29]
MIARLLLLCAMLMATPALAQVAPRQNAIVPELVVEHAARPGGEVELAILMRTSPGWHGYWSNPGDAGLPMSIEWQLPPGASVGPLRYPVPGKLLVADIVNHVFERDYAILTRLRLPAGVSGFVPIRATATWLACTDQVCVPEKGEFSATVPIGPAGASDARFDGWRRALPRPLSSPARFQIDGDRLRIAIPLPASVELDQPIFFPSEDGPIDYPAPQIFRRDGDTLIADLKRRRGEPGRLGGVLALGDGRGLEIDAVPGAVSTDGKLLGSVEAGAVVLAILGALVGGMLLNLMPCVFPILALKALHLAKAGGDERASRRDALGYALGAVLGTAALGVALLAIRAGGSSAGWAFQLQDPRTIVLLLLLATAITLNLLRLFELPAVGTEARPTGSIGTGALAAFVATPCAGPFLGAALGTALLLPAWGSLAVFAALGLGIALPFVAVAFIPALRRRLPKPGPWMVRLQRFLAIPMAATAVGCLWLLWRQAGTQGLLIGLAGVAILILLLALVGRRQRGGKTAMWALPAAALVAVAGAVAVPAADMTTARIPLGAEKWSEAAVARTLASGKPAFVYFTADWCLSCKANEAGAIERESTRDAFREAGVKVLAGDWTNGDPAITRFLETRGRAGVPLYLWYDPGAEPEELPQILTPAMLSERASRRR